MEEINIPYNKDFYKKTITPIIILGIIALYFLFNLDNSNSFFISEKIYKLGFAILLLTLCFIFFAKMKNGLPKTPAMILNEECLIDNISKRIIYWKDVKDLELSKNNFLNILLIYPYENKKYLKANNILDRIRLRFGYWEHGTPISIYDNARLGCSFSELVNLIIEMRKFFYIKNIK